MHKVCNLRLVSPLYVHLIVSSSIEPRGSSRFRLLMKDHILTATILMVRAGLCTFSVQTQGMQLVTSIPVGMRDFAEHVDPADDGTTGELGDF